MTTRRGSEQGENGVSLGKKEREREGG